MKFFSPILLLFFSTQLFAQENDSIPSNILSAIEVKTFGQVRKLKDVPAAVNFVNQQTLNRFGVASVVQAINTTPGVRMEERSPGSYRFNIRGSSLRSPFGVRNVKVYFNDIPITDPGGNTYLNSLGYYNFNSIEILKGPGSSLYGAGTGGVLLIESMNANEKANAFGEYATGSYGLRNEYASVTIGDVNNKSKIGYQHQQSEGYRNHSALKRNVLSWSGRFGRDENHQLKTTFLYSDLFYETPGALTKAEFETNPKLARPAGGGFPSAEQSKASIDQKTFLAGASFTQKFSSSFSNTSTAYGMFTQLLNPTIRNYGKSSEPHFGGRTIFSWTKDFTQSKLNLAFGGEWQQNFTSVNIYKNNAGEQDSLQTADDFHTRQEFVFAQGSVTVNGWEFTTGASLYQMKISFQRSSPAPLPLQKRTFNNEVAPRVAIAKKFSLLTVYSSISKGFSPPSSAELLPSGSNINLDLQAEHGINYEVGLKSSGHRWYAEVNIFDFYLKNTIVQRRDSSGGDYYINAGSTKQQGVETQLHYQLMKSTSHLLTNAMIWISHTFNHFWYVHFKQLSIDYTGNQVPGIAPHTIATGLDATTKSGLSANLTYFYSGPIALNDANSEYARQYHLMGAKIGFEKWLKNKARLKIVGGVDNLLDQHYSLGNDINGFGGRYYNAAAGRNYYASLIVQWLTKIKPSVKEGL